MCDDSDSQSIPVSRRAASRAQRARKRKRIANVVLNVWQSRNPVVLQNMVRNADNPKFCSKACCKNPRRSKWMKAGGKTLRELRDDVAEQTQILEIYEDTFVCSNCGESMPESFSSGETSECNLC